MKYSKDHVWVKYCLESKRAEFGVTHFAQKDIGLFDKIELPEPGSSFKKEEVMGKLESSKNVLNLYAPFDCDVLVFL